MSLPAGYEICAMTESEFAPLFGPAAAAMHSGLMLVRNFPTPPTHAAAALRARTQQLYSLRLGLFHGAEFVGWSYGFQTNAETFYMCDSAILPAHRRKGLYSALTQEVLRIATHEGFEKIFSRHSATNNEILIAKMKLGFTITQLELSEHVGTVVHLTYLVSALRRKLMKFRAGEQRPDAEIKGLLNLE